MYDDFDRRKPRSITFKAGLTAGVLLLVVNLVLWFATQDGSAADLLTWILQIPVLFFAGYSAAQKKVDSQMESMKPLDGVIGAGVGAALIACVVLWIYTLARDLVADTSAFSDFLGIIRIPLDVLLALGLGALSGNMIMRRYRSLHGDFYSDDF